jgi:AcrR family transcriptional regulator
MRGLRGMAETSLPRRASPPTRRAAPARERLLAEALVRFEANGALAATLEDIRRGAGVSVGALYHHFPHKAGLAAALYAELTHDFQRGFLAELDAHRGAEPGVKAGVRQYLRWVSANRSAARFLLAGRPRDDAELRAHNRAFFARATAWWQRHVDAGALRDLPFELIHALWLGPAQEYTRHWLAGRGGRVPAAVADTLAVAAWQTLEEAP